MDKGLGYSITVAFIIPIVFGIGTQNGCDFACYNWFFSNTDLHFKLELGGHFKSELDGQYSRNLHVGVPKLRETDWSSRPEQRERPKRDR